VPIGFVVSFCLGIAVVYYYRTRKNNPTRILSMEPRSKIVKSELDTANSGIEMGSEITNNGSQIEVTGLEVNTAEPEIETGIKAREVGHLVEDVNAVNQMSENDDIAHESDDDIINEMETNQ